MRILQSAGILWPFLLNWGATVLIETVAAFLCALRLPHNLVNVVLINSLTNPSVNLLLLLAVSLLGAGAYLPCAVVLELAVWLSEAFLYRATLLPDRGRLSKHPFLLSLLLNALSLSCGLLFYRCF